MGGRVGFFEVESGEVVPELQTVCYILVTDMLCTEGFISEQRCVIELMIQRGVEPDVVTYNILMDGFCVQDPMDKARKVYNLMLERACYLDAWC